MKNTATSIVDISKLREVQQVKNFVHKILTYFATHMEQKKLFFVRNATPRFVADLNQFFNDKDIGLKAEQAFHTNCIIRVWVDDPFSFDRYCGWEQETGALSRAPVFCSVFYFIF